MNCLETFRDDRVLPFLLSMNIQSI